MALYDGFFDAVQDESTGEYDRVYSSGDFTGYFANVIGSGVCIHNNPDSFKAEYEDGTLYLRPGYLFIQGYWLANKAGDGETNYKGYAVTLPSNMTGSMAVVAHLNLGKRMIEIGVQPVSQEYPDSLVLAIVTTTTAEDTRYNTDICGVIDTVGELSNKVEWALNYIDTEIDGKLQQVEQDIAAQDAKLDAKIAEVEAVAGKIFSLPIGTIKYSAANSVGDGWLKCDGHLISIYEYYELANLLMNTPGLDTDTAEINFFWEASVLPSRNDWTGVAYGNGKFVVIASGANSTESDTAYSYDGKNWTSSSLPPVSSTDKNWSGIAFGGGKFVAVSKAKTNSTSAKAAYSTDGINWTASALPASGDWRKAGITYGNGRFVAIGYSGAAYSTNGISWSLASVPGSSYVNSDVTYGGGKFVAVGSGKATYSTDGITWTDVNLPSAADEYDSWRSVAYGNGKFIAISYKGVLAYSTDGVSWSSSGTLTSGYWYQITFGNGLFAAVGSSNSAYSEDGITWSDASMPTSSVSVQCIGYGAGVFVALTTNSTGQSNAAAYSMPFSYVKLPTLSVSGIPAWIKAKEADQ